MEENLYQYSILKSGIQKYIRRSNKEKALLCVAKLLKKYSSHSQWLNLVNRLGVIACEDISIADLTLIYFLMRQIETIRSDTINRVDYIKINFENKYKLLAPLIVLMSECEKCRITDHIFHGVYSTIEDKPYILDCISGEKKECDLDNCIDLRHDGIIYYWNFYDKKALIDKLLDRMNSIPNIMDYYGVLDSNAKFVREGFLMYYVFILGFVHNIEFKKIDYNVNIELYNYNGDEIFEIDDWVVDKHTKLGRARGKNIHDFVKEGSYVYPESKMTNKSYKKLYDDALIKKFS